MSWSFSGIGEPAAVLLKMYGDLGRYSCSDPEESIKKFAMQAIDKALSAMPADCPVAVEASGSQSVSIPYTATNQLSLSIKPLWGFIYGEK